VSEIVFDVAGARGPKQFFESLTRATMAHGYLFVGPPGAGKKTFARRLAQSLLCESPGPAAIGYDGTCRSCVLFASAGESRHPDFFENTGELRIGEGDVGLTFHDSDGLTARQLVRSLAMQSYSGGSRVLLLGDVTFATDAAPNALLKFLEDPPGAVTTILTTSAPDTLLPTIRSRLVSIAFPPLTIPEVAGVLRARGIDEVQAQRVAALSGGSVSRSLAMLEDGSEESLRGVVAAWFFAGVRGAPAASQWATRETLADGLTIVRSLARDWITAGTLGAVSAPLAPDYATAVAEFRPLDRAGAARLLTKLDDAHRMSQSNVTPTLVAEAVRMALAPGDLTTSA
jgi:DNA polymerase III subunit delta'